MGFSPCRLAFSLLSSFFSSCLGRHVSETLQMQLLLLLGDTISRQSPRSSGSYTLSIHSFTMFFDP